MTILKRAHVNEENELDEPTEESSEEIKDQDQENKPSTFLDLREETKKLRRGWVKRKLGNDEKASPIRSENSYSFLLR